MTPTVVAFQYNPATLSRTFEVGGAADGPGAGQRSALDDTDWHEIAKERFADDLADLLYRQAHKHRFDSIVLVAPPSTLGDLRDKLHKEVRAKVLHEVPKTLTNHPLRDIESLVKKELAAA